MAKSAAMDLGVQSWCFRDFKDNRKVAELTRKIGVDKIELCGVHADFGKPEAFGEVVKIYGDAGVKIVSMGVQTFEGDEATERKWFECAKVAGAKHLSAHFRVNSFQTAVPKVSKWCAEYGIKVGIHCHGGYMFGGQPDVLKHLLSLGSNDIGINIDTAWCMQIGPEGDPIKWVNETFKGRVCAVHYKDFTFDRRARWQDVVVGTGNLDLPGFVKALENNNFSGPAIIEYEAHPENPVPALTECVNSMRAAGGK